MNEAPGISRESRRILTRLLEHPRIEVFPSKGVEEKVKNLPKGTKVTVTSSPGRGIEATLMVSEQLIRRGLRPVPHISARLIADKFHLEKILHRLANGNLREIFVIGGDVQDPVGPYDSSLALLNAIEEAGYTFEQVGIAAYPEGHPFISDEILLQSLQEKQPFATYAVTQMCFDAKVIVSWISDCRQQGIRLPVYVGIPGVVDTTKLFKMALQIGVGESTRFLKSHTDLVRRMVRPGYSPDQLIYDLSRYSAESGINIEGLNIYTFNQIESTEHWRKDILNSIKGPSTP